MNKATRISLIVLLTLLVIIISVGFVFLLKNNGFSFLNFRFSGKESTNLIVDKVYEDVYDSIEIDTEAGNVYLKNTTDNNIRVVIYGEEENSSVESNTETLRITGNTKKCSFICINNEVAKIEVYLPNDYDKKVKITNDVGDIKVEKFDNLYTDISSDTGDITIDTIKSANIKVHTGDVEIKEVNELIVSTTTGDIEIEKINNYVESSSTTGDVTIDYIKITKDSKIDTTTGDVLIKSTTEMYIDARTSVGDTNINNNYRTAEFSLNIKTTTGDIDVKN